MTTDEKSKDTLRLELTPAQTRHIKAQTGKVATAIELTVDELEERVSPGRFQFG